MTERMRMKGPVVSLHKIPLFLELKKKIDVDVKLVYIVSFNNVPHFFFLVRCISSSRRQRP